MAVAIVQTIDAANKIYTARIEGACLVKVRVTKLIKIPVATEPAHNINWTVIRSHVGIVEIA